MPTDEVQKPISKYQAYHLWEKCLYYGGKWHTICRVCGIEGPEQHAYGWYGICDKRMDVNE